MLLYCYFIVIIANCCWYKVKELRHKIFYSPNLGYWSVRLVLSEGSLMKSVHPMWSRNVLHILIKKSFCLILALHERLSFGISLYLHRGVVTLYGSTSCSQ